MIQDIYPYHFNNAFKEGNPRPEDYIFDVNDDGVICKIDNSFFRVKDIKLENTAIYLFSIDDIQFFYHSLPAESSYISFKQLRQLNHPYLGFAAITARHLIRWYKENRYCGKCGSKLEQDKVERALQCGHCHHIIYPKIAPAVIVGIINQKNEILLAKHASSTTSNFILIAGYTEIGETIEETVYREVKEETGLHVKQMRYYASQPWGISSAVLLGFWAIADVNEKIIPDSKEIQLAVWKSVDEVTLPQDMSSLTAQMMYEFKNKKISYEILNGSQK